MPRETSPLRTAEITAHATSAVAVTTTLVMVAATGAVDESNPLVAWLMCVAGAERYLLATPLGVAAIFALLRHDLTGASIDATLALPGQLHRSLGRLNRLHVGYAVAAVLALDAAGNLLVVAHAGVPPMHPELIATLAGMTAAVIGISLICLWRPHPRRLAGQAYDTLGSHRAAIGRGVTVAMVVALVGAPIVGFVPISSLHGSSATGVAFGAEAGDILVDDFEDGDANVLPAGWTGWSQEGSVTSTDRLTGSYAGTISGDVAVTEAKTPNGETYRPNTITLQVEMGRDSTSYSGYYGYVAGRIKGSQATGNGVYFNMDSGNIEWGLAGSAIGSSWSADTPYEITLEPDWDAETVDVTVTNMDTGNVTAEATDVSLGGPSNFESLRIQTDGGDPRTIWYDEVKLQGLPHPSKNITVRVTDQDGDGVSNARVSAWAVDYEKFDQSIDIAERHAQAKAKLDDAADVSPPEWDTKNPPSELPWDNPSTAPRYVAAYSESNINPQGGILDSANLESPQRQFPADEKIYLTVWNALTEGFPLQTGYNSQLFGTLEQNASIRIQGLDGEGNAISQRTVEIDQRHSGGDIISNPLAQSDLPYTSVNLAPGYYRIAPTGDESKAYTIQVGDVGDIISATVKNRTSNSGGLYTGTSQDNRNRLNNNTFRRQEFYTNESGYATISLEDSSLKTVGIQARKLGGKDMESFDAGRNLTQQAENTTEAVRNERRTVYLPTETKKVTLPENETVNVKVREMSWTLYGNSSFMEDRLADWRLDQLGDMGQTVNGTLADEWANLRNGTLAQSDLNNLSQGPLNRSQIESLYNKLNNMTKRNERLNQRYQDLLRKYEANQRNDTVEELDGENVTEAADEKINRTIDPNEATNETLRQRIAALETALELAREEVQADANASRDIDAKTVSATFTVPANLDPDDVLVTAQTGVSSTPVADEYVTITKEGQTVGDTVTTIRVEDYPVQASDPSLVTFEVEGVTIEDDSIVPDFGDDDTSTNDTSGGDTSGGDSSPVVGDENGSIVREQITVVNPTVDAEPPEFQSVSLGNGYPAPNETATLTVVPGPGGNVGSIQSADVYYPNESVAAANVTGRTISFPAGDPGMHIVKATMQPVGSDTNFTETFRVRSARARTQPAMVRSAQGATGEFTVTANGIERANVDRTGDVVEISAYASEGNSPSEVHLWTTETDLPPEADINVNLVKSDGQTYDSNARVHVHTQAMPSRAIVYREADGDLDPIGMDEKTEYGVVEDRNGGQVITTATDATGSVTIRTDTDPGIIDRTVYGLRLRGVPVPSLGLMLVPISPLPAGATLTVVDAVVGAFGAVANAAATLGSLLGSLSLSLSPPAAALAVGSLLPAAAIRRRRS